MGIKISGEKDFLKSVNDTIEKNQHVEYLQEVLKKYEEYKKEFENIFTKENPQDSVYKFRATYILKKPVWREIEIHGKQSFNDLAEIMIYSMGWENDHMHGFELPRKKRRKDPLHTGSSLAFFAPYWEDDPHPTYKTDEIKIQNVDYQKNPKFEFIFDFGDGHRFDVEFKKSRKLKSSERMSNFPKLTDQRGVGPVQYPAWE